MQTEEIKTAYNSTYPKVAVQWLNEALCTYQSLCLADSEVLRNRHLRVAAKRYQQWQKQKNRKTRNMKTIFNLFTICFFSITIVSCGGASDKKAVAKSEIQEEEPQIQKDSNKVEEVPVQETPQQVQETPEQIETENVWETIEFKNYTIDYPKNRRLVKNSPEGNFTLYLLTGQTDNLMMKINDLAGYMLTLDSYSFQFYDEYFRRTNVTLLEDKTITINKQPCHKFVATADDGHGEIEYKTMVYIWVKNNWAYNLIFSAKPDKYDELKPIAQKVADSFKLTK